jgi:hypothetical protein
MAERHRCQIDLMVDEMVAAGKSGQDILTAIVAQYRPYDTLPAFDEGFNAYQASATRMTMPQSAKTPSLPVSARSTAKRTTAAPTPQCELLHARQCMKPPAK